MAISFHGIASTPENDGSNSDNPVVITPPSNMLSGDLVVVIITNRLESQSLSVNNSGGQTWTSLDSDTGNLITVRWFWCIYDGAWDANPSFTNGGTNVIGMMLVFRPTSGYSWQQDVALTIDSFSAPASPYGITISGITTASNSVMIASWSSKDNNSWTYTSGGSTSPAGGSVNNIAGSDSSIIVAYKLMSSGGSTGDQVATQVSAVSDNGVYAIMSFKEITTANTYELFQSTPWIRIVS